MISKQLVDELVYQYGHLRAMVPSLLRRPIGYFLYITGQCNLDCSYCWQRHQEDLFEVDGWTNTTNKALTPDEWVKVVNGLPRGSFLGLSGGEATISPALGPVIEAAVGRFPISVNTNFMSVKDEHFDLLTKSGIRNLSISIDGFAEVHDWSRQRKGLFDKIVDNIGRLNAVRKGRHSPTLTIKTVLMNENIDRMVEFHRFCADTLKADELNISFEKVDNHYQFSLLHNRDSRKVFANSRPRLYDYQSHDRILEVLGTLLEMNGGSRCNLVIYPRMKSLDQIRYFLDGKGDDVYAPCYLPLSMVTVLPDGEVIPCLSNGLGNVRDAGYSVAKVLAGNEYRNFWKDLVSNPRLPKACNVCCFSKVEH